MLVATATSAAASAACFWASSNGWIVPRDKKGTSGVQEKEHGSQVTGVSALTSRFSFERRARESNPQPVSRHLISCQEPANFLLHLGFYTGLMAWPLLEMGLCRFACGHFG
jgi:hypothetical protein